jgi:hypothetical protein
MISLISLFAQMEGNGPSHLGVAKISYFDIWGHSGDEYSRLPTQYIRIAHTFGKTSSSGWEYPYVILRIDFKTTSLLLFGNE